MSTEKILQHTLDVPIEIQKTKLNGFDINYAKTGEGEPLVLIHGANFGWGVWYPNIPELAKHFTVYAIDLPGAGRSSRVNYATLDMHKGLVDTVDAFVQHHELKNFHVMGCSAGGWIAFQLALRYPDKVRKIVVENSAGLSDGVGISDRMIGIYPFANLIAKTALNPNRKDKSNIEKFLMDIFHKKDHIKREFVDYFLETMETSHNLLFISRMTARWKDFVLKHDLPRIHNDTLIVWGAKDTLMPLHKNEHNFQRLPQVSVQTIDDAGHIPSLEQPALFNSLAVDFLTTS